MVATTRNLASNINNFLALSTLTDYPLDTESNMSSAPLEIVSDNANPFAGEIKIGDRVGKALFAKATEGLPHDKKLDFSIENAQVFKSKMDTAKANFVWGPVTFSIQDIDGV